MKLLIAVVHSEDASSTMDALNDRGISVTRFASSGGFLQHKNVTLMSGIDDDRIEEVLGLIKENCRTRSEFMNPMPPLVEPGDFFVPYPVEVQVGGAADASRWRAGTRQPGLRHDQPPVLRGAAHDSGQLPRWDPRRCHGAGHQIRP